MLIRKLGIEDQQFFKEATDLLNRTQGMDLFKPDYVRDCTLDPNCLVVAAIEGESCQGLGVAKLIDNYDFYLPFAPGIGEELRDKKVGSFSTLAITEGQQGKGIGQSISKVRLQWLKDQGCQVIVGVSWVSGLPHTSDRVFTKMGFTPCARVENFFHDSSLKDPFFCPGCGEPPCTCAAVLYRLNISA